jgi:lipoprotein-releasing system ATP-binding protein
MKYIIKAEEITKQYHDGDKELVVLNSLDLKVGIGEKVAIYGQSGSGKSTLLHVLAGLDFPTSGHVVIDKTIITSLSENKKAMLRNKYLGFVYQFHHLLPEFTAQENIAMPLLIAGENFNSAMDAAKDWLIKVGLINRVDHKPAQLSGGERQRVAIARALITKPKCILADEPTGNLDQKNAENILDLLLKLNDSTHTSIILVTHDQAIAKQMDTVYQLVDGRLK